MGSILDQPERVAALDRGSMGSLLESFPQQVQSAVELGQKVSLESPGRIANLVVCGLGGSAIGGEIVRCAVERVTRIPMLVSRDYRLAAFVDASSMILLSSYSGNTEETLSSYAAARSARAHAVCITSGGRLAELARADGLPLVLVPGGLPPRVAVGFSAFVILGCLRALELVPDMTQEIRETIDVLKQLVSRYRQGVPESSNPAKRLALDLHGKIVAVYGSTGLTEAAATRWRGQMEENAKNLAFHHVLPEMNHNELVGWECPAEVLRRLAVVFLRDRGEHVQVKRRFELTRDLIAGPAGCVHDVWSDGKSLLARVFSLVSLGDFTSLYLAYLNGVDPTPVHAVETLKRKLSDLGDVQKSGTVPNVDN